MATAFAASSSPQIATLFSSSQARSYFSLPTTSRTRNHPSLPSTSPNAHVIPFPSTKFVIFHDPLIVIFQRNGRRRRIHAAPEDVLPSDAADQIGSSTNDGTVISALLFVAFVGLSILTIGVIYLAVTDFLQKREKEKFEKEEAAANKSGKKKRKVRARTGPRGFGQKIDEDD